MASYSSGTDPLSGGVSVMLSPSPCGSGLCSPMLALQEMKKPITNTAIRRTDVAKMIIFFFLENFRFIFRSLTECHSLAWHSYYIIWRKICQTNHKKIWQYNKILKRIFPIVSYLYFTLSEIEGRLISSSRNTLRSAYSSRDRLLCGNKYTPPQILRYYSILRALRFCPIYPSVRTPWW